jgi:predicted neutral ceramidase superfamily lipid hydrolase
MLELLKLIVQPVILERDPDGNVAGERFGEQIVLYTRGQLDEFYLALEAAILTENEKEVVADAGNRDNGVADQLRQPGLPRQHARPG